MTQKKFKVKSGDFVQVMTGRDKGKRGFVQKVLLDSGKVIVNDVNVVLKSKKPSQEDPSGGFVKKTLPIDISNVALVDPTTNKPGRVTYDFFKIGVNDDEKGVVEDNKEGSKEGNKKVRVFKKTGAPVQRTEASSR